jgi:shikimate kinase
MTGFICLNYFYSDKLVEDAVGMPSVAQIFKVHSEAFFRDSEVKAAKFYLLLPSILRVRNSCL